MRELDEIVIASKSDPKKLERFISDNEPFIMNCATHFAKKYVSKQDDLWSVALDAFYHAIQKYELDRGGFFPFAELVIERRLIDYVRSQAKYRHEIQTDTFEPYKLFKNEQDDLKYEIEAIEQVLSAYGFTFMELSKCSPKSKKTKCVCANAVTYLLNDIALIGSMSRTGQLPIKNIEKDLKIPRKILERHRKYIIAAVEILHGDYPYLSEYFKYIREEAKK